MTSGYFFVFISVVKYINHRDTRRKNKKPLWTSVTSYVCIRKKYYF